MTNPQDTIARLLCDDAAARQIANQEAAPCFDESAPHVQEYWRALAAALSVPNPSSVRREAVARIVDPTAWSHRDNFLKRKTGEGWRVGPEVWQMRADDVVASSLAKADAILALLPSVPAGEPFDICPQCNGCGLQNPQACDWACETCGGQGGIPSVPAGVSEEELSHLRQTVEYLTGVPRKPGVINDYRAPEVDQAILRCRERGDDDTAHVLAQMRLVYRRQSNELQDALAALASPSPDTPPEFFYPIEDGLLDQLSDGPFWLWHRLWDHARQGWYDREAKWWKIGYPDGGWWGCGIFPSHYASVTPREYYGREREVTLEGISPSPDTPEKRMLLDLLAVIHRDGGHYTDEHGLAASVADAMLLSSERLPDTPEIEGRGQ